MKTTPGFELSTAAKAALRPIARLFAYLTRPAPCSCRVLYRSAEGATGAFDLRTATCADISKLVGRHLTLIYGKGCYHEFRCPGFQAYWESWSHPDIAWCEREVHSGDFSPKKHLREEFLEGSSACESCPFNKNWESAEVCNRDHDPIAATRVDRTVAPKLARHGLNPNLQPIPVDSLPRVYDTQYRTENRERESYRLKDQALIHICPLRLPESATMHSLGAI